MYFYKNLIGIQKFYEHNYITHALYINIKLIDKHKQPISVKRMFAIKIDGFKCIFIDKLIMYVFGTVTFRWKNFVTKKLGAVV
jgi:hypothetical protein